MLNGVFMNKKVLIAGGSGLIGSALSQKLSENGYEVAWLSRSKSSSSPYPVFLWDLKKHYIEPKALEFGETIINLSGAGIADKLWTSERKQLIIDSRVKGNLLLAETLSKGQFPIKNYISGAAIGYYGNRGNTLLSEDMTATNDGFLSYSCIEWENAIKKVSDLGIRTGVFRIGLVLTTEGGVLEKIALPLKFFLAPYFGSGNQWYSWIHIEDMTSMLMHFLETPTLEGTFNAVAPNPVTNKEIMETLKSVMRRPALLFSIPEFAIRLGLGEMADTVFSSAKVSAEKILNTGFVFQFPDIRRALEDLF